ncbi:MAG: hypothetical protein CSA26_02790 [Desulfobacterales bacterium]|nr:MAG: hypothetical protein CSA26_02790 [Desulfobacterales bacterium]
MSHIEKRKHTRFITLHLLHYTLLDNEGCQSECSMARTFDISLSGIKIETTKLLPEQATLILSLELEEHLVNLEGKIIYCHENANRYISGIQFKKINPKEYDVLRHYVDEFRNRKKEMQNKDNLPKLDIQTF